MKAKDQIKRALWSRGYKVKDVSGTGAGYDLLVEGKFRVRCIVSTTNGQYQYQTNGCEAMAIFVKDGKVRERYMYSGMNGVGEHGPRFENFTTNPHEVFGRPA